MITYSNAKNKIGTIVNIDKVTGESRHEQYFCIGCEREMIPVLGDKREHHFRHKEDCECNGETYLHNYAKNYIKQVFDTSKEFYISYQIPKICCNHNNCKYRINYDSVCKITKLKRVDIKKYYDTCELESKYNEGNDFTADLKIYNKNNLLEPPIFIEIAVTHKCEEEKILLGFRIIEISLKNKEIDVKNLIKNEIKNYNKTEIEVVFHNFEENIFSKKPLQLQSYYIWHINNDILQSKKYNDCHNYKIKRHYPFPIEVHSKNISYEIISKRHCYRCEYYEDTSKKCRKKVVIKHLLTQALYCPIFKSNPDKKKSLFFGIEKSYYNGVYSLNENIDSKQNLILYEKSKNICVYDKEKRENIFEYKKSVK